MAARQIREVARRFSSWAKNRGQALVLEVLSLGARAWHLPVVMTTGCDQQSDL
jgi:hypothetical protein